MKKYAKVSRKLLVLKNTHDFKAMDFKMAKILLFKFIS